MEGFPGVLGTFSTRISPDPSTRTRSVWVPPTSTPRRYSFNRDGPPPGPLRGSGVDAVRRV